MQEPNDKRPCIKCYVETRERIFNLKESVPFCEWCYQAFLGRVRGDSIQTSPRPSKWPTADDRMLDKG